MRGPERTVSLARDLRRALSPPEVLLWQALRGNALGGLRFRRQHSVGPYVLDFFCAPARLAVEVDGSAHDHPDRAARDASRDAWLAARGIAVLRVPAADVIDRARRVDVLATILAAAAPSTAPRAVPLPRRAGEDDVPRPED